MPFNAHNIPSNVKFLCIAIINDNKIDFAKYFKKIKLTEINQLFCSTRYEQIYDSPTTALHLAVWLNREDFTETLLKKANPKVIDANGATILHIAAMRGYTALVRRLIPLSDINVKENEQRTALSLAAKNGHVDIVRLLCELPNIELIPRKTKASAADPNSYIVHPLALAIYFSQTTCLEIILSALLKKVTPDELVNELKQALNLAQQCELEKISFFTKKINDFISIKKNNNEAKKEMQTTLAHNLIHDNKANELKKLIVAGFNVNTRLPRAMCTNGNADAQCTMLMCAANLNKLNIVNMLLEQGADPNIEAIDGTDPLLVACEHGFIEIITALLKSDKINLLKIYKIQSGDHSFPKEWVLPTVTHEHRLCNVLTYVITHGKNKVPILKLLLGANADPSQTIDGVPLALSIALQKKIKAAPETLTETYKIAKLMIAATKKLDDVTWQPWFWRPFSLVVCRDKAKLIAMFLEHPNAGIYFDQSQKDCFLNLACVFQLRSAMSELIKHGANSTLPMFDHESFTIAEWLDLTNDVLNVKSGVEDHSSLPLSVSGDSQQLVSSTTESAIQENRFRETKQEANMTETVFETSSTISMSGRKYLINQLGFTQSDIDYFNFVKKPKKTAGHRKSFLSQSHQFATQIYTWFDGMLTSTKLTPINNANFYFFPSKLITKQIQDAHYSETLLELFLKVRPKFDGHHLKILDQRHTINVNGKSLILSHELKIKESPARLLVAAVPCDNQRAVLYLPALFLPNGLHKLCDSKALNSTHKQVKIDFEEEVQAHNATPSL